VQLPVFNIGAPLSVSFDAISRRRFIYWIDANSGVKRATDLHSTTVSCRSKNKNILYLKAQTMNLLRDCNCEFFYSLTVDDVGRQLFVSCAPRGIAGSFVHVWRINVCGEKMGHQSKRITQSLIDLY
jgi:hypothetical protein